jgi:hypothetical protein
MSVTAFAYAQVRLQARHAERPGLVDWRRVQGVNDINHYLQVARRTRLRPWVLNLHGAYDSYQFERALRQQYCDYIDEIALWLPAPWARTLDWLKHLPDLPAIQYLLSGAPPQSWMLNDPRLQAFVKGEYRQRMQALDQSDIAGLVTAWQRGESIVAAWFEQWRTSWPPESVNRRGLDELTRLLRRHWSPKKVENSSGLEGARDVLLQKLTLVFRRYSFQPASCYAHLALTALDLLVLRGELLRRVLFSDNGVGRS